MAIGKRDFREGYLIEHSNDTVRGFIDLGSNVDNAQECVFKALEDDEVIVYSPEDIQSYRLLGDEKYYITKEINIAGTRSLVFLEYLVDGISDLFYLKLPRQEFYFLEGKNNSLLSLSNDTKIVNQQQEGYFGNKLTYSGKGNQYRRIMTSTFHDSPETLEKIQSTAFSHQGLSISLRTTTRMHAIGIAFCLVDKRGV